MSASSWWHWPHESRAMSRFACIVDVRALWQETHVKFEWTLDRIVSARTYSAGRFSPVEAMICGCP
jgi:hypothetical protein